jgi:cell division protease FtsH
MSRSPPTTDPQQTSSPPAQPNGMRPTTPPEQRARSAMQRLPKWPWWVSFLVVLVANYFLMDWLFPPEPTRVQISYTYFKEQVTTDNVAEISSRGDTIQGKFRQPVSYPPNGGENALSVSEFTTVQPQFADPGLETLLNEHGVQINARSLDEPRNPLLTLLISFGPTLLLIGGFMWLSKKYGQMGGGMFGMGKSQAKRYDQMQDSAKVTFADVAGID